MYLDIPFNPRGEHDESTEPAYIQTSIQINHPITIMYYRNRVFLECVPRSIPVPHQRLLQDESCNPWAHLPASRCTPCLHSSHFYFASVDFSMFTSLITDAEIRVHNCRLVVESSKANILLHSLGFRVFLCPHFHLDPAAPTPLFHSPIPPLAS